MPPTPIWKMRSLLFLLVCARADQESDATPAVRMAPFRKKVRRVMGEADAEFFIMDESYMAQLFRLLKQKRGSGKTVTPHLHLSGIVF